MCVDGNRHLLGFYLMTAINRFFICLSHVQNLLNHSFVFLIHFRGEPDQSETASPTLTSRSTVDTASIRSRLTVADTLKL